MERYREVIGLPVISFDDGKSVGVVKEVLFLPKKKEVRAFILTRTEEKERNSFVFLEDVLSLNKDALMIYSRQSIQKMNFKKRIKEFSHSDKINGLKVLTKTGEEIGIVKDILFDLQHGLIEGLEVSDGLIQDLMQGRNFIPLFGKVQFGEKNIVVENEAIEEMNSTGKGIKNLLWV